MLASKDGEVIAPDRARAQPWPGNNGLGHSPEVLEVRLAHRMPWLATVTGARWMGDRRARLHISVQRKFAGRSGSDRQRSTRHSPAKRYVMF